MPPGGVVKSYALELLRAVSDLDTVYVGVGRGSGICGLITVPVGVGAAIYLGAVLGGLMPVPDPLRPLAEWWWARA